jgi:hypothetical protein
LAARGARAAADAGDRVPQWRIVLQRRIAKELIRRELLSCATAKPMERPTYSEFGQRVGIPPQGPWKTVLDSIADDEDDAKRPDVTFLIKNKKTGYPSRIGRVTKRNPDSKQRVHARKKMQKIIDTYNPGTPNPFP